MPVRRLLVGLRQTTNRYFTPRRTSNLHANGNSLRVKLQERRYRAALALGG